MIILSGNFTDVHEIWLTKAIHCILCLIIRKYSNWWWPI